MSQVILPPIERGTVQTERINVPTTVPPVPTQDIVSSALTRWHANSNARTTDAIARLNTSGAGLVAAQTHLVESVMRHREALFRVQELPERLNHELAVRRLERLEVLRQVQHTQHINELHRKRDEAEAEAKLIQAQATVLHAKTVLSDAEQQLQAQRDHGYLHYELEHKRKALERLDIQLSEQERRALLDKHLRKTDEPMQSDIDEDEIDDALIARQQQLAASGLDTTKIDAVIKARRAAREHQAED